MTDAELVRPLASRTRTELAPSTTCRFVKTMAGATKKPATGAKAASSSAARTAIATVDERVVSRDEFERRAQYALDQYRARSGADVPADYKAVIRRQVLESMIRHELLVLEAKRRGMVGSDAEADAEVRKDPYFNPNGKFDPQRYAAIRSEHPQAYEAALQQVKDQLAARDLDQKVQG
jgi:hypothetical protein